MNTIYKSRRDRRGSVLILVVAVLALLVLMGTAYIVSARTDRANATAMSASNNVDLARDAVMSQVQQAIGSAMLDSKGNVGGYDTTGTYTRATGPSAVATALAARNYDYPELGTTYGVTTANPTMQDEPWLAAKLHNPVSGKDISQLTQFPFDVQTGAYDGLSGVTFPTTLTTTNGFSVVYDQTRTDTSGDDPANPSAMGQITPNSYADSYINLLPFSDASGVRYRFGVRILDTSRMANLNTGNPNDSLTDATGTNLASIRLAPNVVTPTNYYNLADVAQTLQSSRAGALNFTAFSVWEPIVLSIEKPSTPNPLTLFDLSDELELRSYGEFGTAYTARPATSTVWPNTLGNLAGSLVKGNPSRRNYTAYSFSRRIRPYPDPTATASGVALPYALTSPTPAANFTGFGNPASPANIWPTSTTGAATPVGISWNPDVSSGTTSDAAFYLTMAATNIATQMESCGYSVLPGSALSSGFVYSADEARAFAANYMTFCWNGFAVDTTVASPPPGGAYTLPAGPSFIDDQGPCFRSATSLNTYVVQDCTSNLASTAASNIVYLGYAAQPFINEVAVEESFDGTQVNITDFAIELYNPYPVALSLNGFVLKFGASTPVSLTGKYIPAFGYLVINQNAGHLDAGITPGSGQGAAQVLAGAPGMVSTTGSVTLERTYYPRATTPPSGGVLAPIDEANFGTLISPPVPTTSHTAVSYSLSRFNGGNPAWAATVNTWAGAPQTPATLGATNSTTGGAGLVLYDRYAVATPPNPRNPLANIAEFNHVMRVCNEFNSSTGASVGMGVVPTHLQTITSAASPPPPFSTAATTPGVWDAQLHFDFYGDPAFYSIAPQPNIDATGKHDIRAVKLFDSCAMIDRVANANFKVNGTALDINELRIPGQINVNTASGDVLFAIPGISVPTNPSPNLLIANILAYRDRDVSGTMKYPAVTGTANSTDFSSIPGKGIRGLPELMVPILATLGTTPATLDARDQIWANICNLCTVRSDSFAVYGYLEAVRQNRNFTGFNASSWYSSVSDDPNNTTSPLIRLGRRRWVAIVDRSFSNYAASDPKYSIPRVVAIKDLPQ
jgi:hypothetical protein